LTFATDEWIFPAKKRRLRPPKEAPIVFFCFVTSRKPVFHSVMPVTKAFVTGLLRALVLPGRKKQGVCAKTWNF
jgi:hypothetical protein